MEHTVWPRQGFTHSGESQASGECCWKAVLFILLATSDIAPARRHYKRDPHNIAVPGVAMLRKAPHANTKSIKKRKEKKRVPTIAPPANSDVPRTMELHLPRNLHCVTS